ncbi:MAG TPA: cell division protein, partial [Burkholderiales bacterium]
MTDLQLGLLVIGVAAVVAVLVYNRLQERKAGGEAQRAFASQHPDALLGASREDPAPAAPRPLPRRMEVPAGGMPDPR